MQSLGDDYLRADINLKMAPAMSFTPVILRNTLKENTSLLEEQQANIMAVEEASARSGLIRE